MESLVLITTENVGFLTDKMLSVVFLHTTCVDILNMGLIYTSPTISHDFYYLSMEYSNRFLTGCHVLLQKPLIIWVIILKCKYFSCFNLSSGFPMFTINPNTFRDLQGHVWPCSVLLSLTFCTLFTVLVTPALDMSRVWMFSIPPSRMLFTR